MKDIENYKDEMNLLHKKAMDLCEEAFFLKRTNKLNEAKEKWISAFYTIHSVADLLIESNEESEPSRSIICNETALIALDAGFLDKAKYYAEKVIEFNKYSDCIEEAKEVLNKIN